GCRIQCCSRCTASSCRFSICAHIGCSSGSSASLGCRIVKDAAPSAAVLTKSLRFIVLIFPPQITPGYASLPARFASIEDRLKKTGAPEATRTQGRFSFFQRVTPRHGEFLEKSTKAALSYIDRRHVPRAQADKSSMISLLGRTSPNIR